MLWEAQKWPFRVHTALLEELASRESFPVSLYLALTRKMS
jgi:hypothetical protein